MFSSPSLSRHPPMMALLDPASLAPRGDFAYRLARLAGLVPAVRYHHYALVLLPRAGLPALPRGWRWNELPPERWLDGPDLGAPLAVCRARHAQGCACLAVFQGDTFAGAAWVSAGPVEEDEVRLRYSPGPGGAWDLGFYVPPERRHGRAALALMAALGEWLDAHRLGWSASRITLYNSASLALHARLGARRIGEVAAATLGPWQALAGWVATGAAGRARLARVTRPHGPSPLLRLDYDAHTLASA